MYDATVASFDDWVTLKPPVIVDPVIYRLGERFLTSTPTGDVDGDDKSWVPISQDISSVVTFFDLLVLHDQLPAFNYPDTFDSDLNFAGGLQALVNGQQRLIQHVSVEFDAYMESKRAALQTLTERIESGAGSLVPTTLATDLCSELTTLEYKWNPGLGDLEHEVAGEMLTVAKFLFGTLLFSTYAQQSGAPQILSAKRSRLFTASSLARPHCGTDVERQIYDELRRRFRQVGGQWRDRNAPWTPSFLPWMLSELDTVRIRPINLLEKVLELREREVVAEYRAMRKRALAKESGAMDELAGLAKAMSKSLRAGRRQLSPTRTILVEISPKVLGAAAGAAVGAPAGPGGAALGAGLGAAAEEALRPLTSRLWGFVFRQLPFISARKMLVRAATADYATTLAQMDSQLRSIWDAARPLP